MIRDDLHAHDRRAARSVARAAVVGRRRCHDRETLLRAGFNGYLSKPIVDDQLLLDAIETYTALPSKVAA